MTDWAAWGFAVAAGSVAALNPCGFALLPGYLLTAVTGDRPVARAWASTAWMTSGFVLVFAVCGLILAPVAATVHGILPIVTVVIGLTLIVLGVARMTGRTIPGLLPRPVSGAPTRSPASMFGYGLAYALTSLSCAIGPFLAATGVATGGHRFTNVLLGCLGYGLGMAVVVGALTLAIAVAGEAAATASRRVIPRIAAVTTVLITISGVYLTYYGAVEVTRAYFGHTGADPAVTMIAGIVGIMSTTVVDLGVQPFLLLIAGLSTVIILRRALSPKRG